MAMLHLFSFYYLCVRALVLSLAHSFGKNSSWIVFLEEETNVRMTKLVQVLAKFDKNKVSTVVPLSLHQLPACLHHTVSSFQAQLIISSVE